MQFVCLINRKKESNDYSDRIRIRIALAVGEIPEVGAVGEIICGMWTS